jgi:hypothetical protein
VMDIVFKRVVVPVKGNASVDIAYIHTDLRNIIQLLVNITVFSMNVPPVNVCDQDTIF